MTNYSVTRFYELDFKDTSEKMENTDKKVQFWVQIYITLISSVLVLFNSNIPGFLESHNNKIIVFSALYLIGQILFCYVLASHSTHTEYVYKMNMIRCLLLLSSGMKKGFIENYGFIKCAATRKLGMTYSIIYLELVGTLVFAWMTINELVNKPSRQCMLFLLLILINIIVLLIHNKRLKNKATDYNKRINALLDSN